MQTFIPRSSVGSQLHPDWAFTMRAMQTFLMTQTCLVHCTVRGCEALKTGDEPEVLGLFPACGKLVGPHLKSFGLTACAERQFFSWCLVIGAERYSEQT